MANPTDGVHSSVALFFLPPALGGGSTSFTAHLFKAFEAAGHTPMIFRVRPKFEHFTRPFGKYEGVKYQNITIRQALVMAKERPSVLTAPAHSKHLCEPYLIAQLVKAGMRIVVHDPNEFKVYDHLDTTERKSRVICIRPTMLKFFPKAKFIPHPYERQLDGSLGPIPRIMRHRNAVSIARISFVKRTTMILEANRLVSEDKQCVLKGAENRLYTRHVLTKKFEEFKQGGYGFPMTFKDAPEICATARFAVDMTYFPEDGGGSQYSFMEAWDAGAVNIVHKDWLRYPGEMHDKYKCVAVDSPTTLAAVLEHSKQYDLARYQQAGYDALKQHDPKLIGKAYMRELTR